MEKEIKMIDKGKAVETYSALNSLNSNAGLKGTVRLHVYNEKGDAVGVHDIYEGYDVDDVMFNTTLNTAKTILSRVAGGDVNYKIAKIAFGNAGHNFSNPKQAVDAVPTDIGLKSAEYIKASLESGDATTHFLYTDSVTTDTYRMVYIEKDILPEHISYGTNGDQFVVRVPISFNEFNHRTGDATTTDVNYDDPGISYKLINSNDGTVMQFGNTNTDGTPVSPSTQTEVHTWDDSGTQRYTFKNGLNGSGVIDTTDGGTRPQEISEILLCADITGDGSANDPYKKLGTSRMTSGLLQFPENFTFTFEWTLTWNFS